MKYHYYTVILYYIILYYTVLYSIFSSGEVIVENHFGNQETYTCMHGDGRHYVGSSKKTKSGAKCVEGTECRNPTPETNARPYCNSRNRLEIF